MRDDLNDLLDRGGTIEQVALHLARDAYPSLDVAAALGQLDALAELIRPAMVGVSAPTHVAAVLGDVLYRKHGFRGNKEDYYDPRNSYLHQVLLRRAGIPITLATVLLAVCRRVGVVAEGIGFPSHFLVRLGSDCFVDPFESARPIPLEKLSSSVPGRASRSMLEPVSTRAMAIRMLNNLRGIYMSQRDPVKLIVVCDRLVELGGEPSSRRDRGLAALALGLHAAARADLKDYLASSPPPADVAAVEEALQTASNPSS